MFSKTHSGLAVACTLFIAASVARAQPAAPAPLEEVIVTATRIEKSLDRVPAAISVVGEDDIQLGRMQLALDEPLSRVPGVYMQDRFNFAQDLRISIRGFGARANFGIRGIKILVDGIPETLPDGQGSVDSVDLGATSQIEVLRGPSSSLWGNASGGVISITSELAPAEPFSEIRVTGGEDDFEKVQFKTGGQGDTMGYLFSLSDSSYDGYRAQSLAENTQLTGRLNFDLGREREFRRYQLHRPTDVGRRGRADLGGSRPAGPQRRAPRQPHLRCRRVSRAIADRLRLQHAARREASHFRA
jgi:iron complex outermembrane receptor protein